MLDSLTRLVPRTVAQQFDSWIFNKVSFQKKQSDYYTIILVSFPLGECVDEVVDSQANYEG